MINGFKKEMLFYTRGGRLIIVLVVMAALALMSPVMFGMMKMMTDTMNNIEGMDESVTNAFAMFSGFTAADITMYTVQYVAGMGAIVTLFLFKGAAGGEQQKRSVIIPQCSGLSAVDYALPKFIIYPLSIIVISMVSVYLGALVSLPIFGGSLDWGMVTISAVCTAGFLGFFTVLQFTIGICTGRSGLAIVICIIAQTFLPSILSAFRIDRFNPVSLYSIALGAALASGESGLNVFTALESSTNTASGDVTALNITISLATAVIISVLLGFVTVFVLHTKEVHNEGDEPVL
ncbi:MAG: hypothetical protein IJT87_02350 [Ruminiclostridium sp.]|nr:hypothetical protein [Ruminiclostridium sp.]